jgi:hypothetical protein
MLNICINDLCAKINFSEFLLVVYDLKIFLVIKSAVNFKLLQSNIDSVQKWCTKIYKKISIFQNKCKFLPVKLTVASLITFSVIY